MDGNPKRQTIVNPVHYQKLTVKQSFDTPNTLLESNDTIDFPIHPHDLSRYDEVLL